jgi:predicted acylesterase/phospholipase RssA
VLLSQTGLDICTAVDRLEQLWLKDISSTSAHPENGVYRFRANPRPYLVPSFLVSNPARPFVELAQDTAFFARDWFRRAVHFASAPESLERKTLELVDLSTLICTDPFRALIESKVNLDALRSSNRALRIVATNWTSGELRVFTNEHMAGEMGRHAVLASAAIPGIFPAVTISGETYVDGGVLMNTPLEPATRAGADTLHVVVLNPDVRKIPLERISNTLDVMQRLMMIAAAGRIDSDIENARSINQGLEELDRAEGENTPVSADVARFLRAARRIRSRFAFGRQYRPLTIHRYCPEQDLGGIFGMLGFDRDRIQSMIRRGYDEAASHDCAANKCVLVSGNQVPAGP